MIEREHLEVSGVVQGVGFRPFVWRLAQRLNLSGEVRNSTDGVLIDVQGERRALDAFNAALTAQPPPLACIDAIRRTRGAPDLQRRGFRIAESLNETAAQSRIPADCAPCGTCLEELFSAENRRWRHPFICCTDCGPRFTLTWRTPYDRAHTSMAAFVPCARCAAEYADPADRRFHAQTLACPDCGPVLRFERLGADANARANATGNTGENANSRANDDNGDGSNARNPDANPGNAGGYGNGNSRGNGNENTRNNARIASSNNAAASANADGNVSGNRNSSGNANTHSNAHIASGNNAAASANADGNVNGNRNSNGNENTRSNAWIAIGNNASANADGNVSGNRNSSGNANTHSNARIASGSNTAAGINADGCGNSNSNENIRSNASIANSNNAATSVNADGNNDNAYHNANGHANVPDRETSPADPIALAWDAIARGEIVAVQGLGGFQLICDATQPAVVKRLRDRKRRPTKPLALLTLNVASAAQWVEGLEKAEETGKAGKAENARCPSSSTRSVPDTSGASSAFDTARINGEMRGEINRDSNGTKETGKSHPSAADLLASAARPVVVLKQLDSARNGNINIEAMAQPDNLFSKVPGTVPCIANSASLGVKTTEKNCLGNASNVTVLPALAAHPIVALKQHSGEEDGNNNATAQPDNLSNKALGTVPCIANSGSIGIKSAEKNCSDNASNATVLPALAVNLISALKHHSSEGDGNNDATAQPDNLPNKSPSTVPCIANSESIGIKSAEKNCPGNASNVTVLPALASYSTAAREQRGNTGNGHIGIDAVARPDNLSSKAPDTAPGVANNELNVTKSASKNCAGSASNAIALPALSALPIVAPQQHHNDGDSNGNPNNDGNNNKNNSITAHPASQMQNARPGAAPAIAPNIAPGLNRLGLMLPSTPIQYLLFHQALGQPRGTRWLDDAQPVVLVATSANLSGEPLLADPDAARRALAGIADALLWHDRQIVARCDDSVILAAPPAVLLLAHTAAPTEAAAPCVAVTPVGSPLAHTAALAEATAPYIAVAPTVPPLAHTATFAEATAPCIAIAPVVSSPLAHTATLAEAAAPCIAIAPAASPLAHTAAPANATAPCVAVTPVASPLVHTAALAEATAPCIAIAPAASPLAHTAAPANATAPPCVTIAPAASPLAHTAAFAKAEAQHIAITPAVPPSAHTAALTEATALCIAVAPAASPLAHTAALAKAEAPCVAIAPAVPPSAHTAALAEAAPCIAITPAVPPLAHTAALTEAAAPCVAVAPAASPIVSPPVPPLASPPAPPLAPPLAAHPSGPPPPLPAIMLRRARGYVPEPIALPPSSSGASAPSVLALGAQMKSTVTLTCGRLADVSPYLGDLRSPGVCELLDETVERHVRRSRVTPDAIACDRQPDLYSTRLAEALAERWRVPLLRIQHHHAHLAAVLAENGHAGPALGLALDGFGWGDDGTAWGGELLRIEGNGHARRLGHISPLPLPGADAAARAPWRMAVALLHVLEPGARRVPPAFGAQMAGAAGMAGMADIAGMDNMAGATRMADMAGMAARLYPQIERGFNCPATTSLGRWFDAIAGLAGICTLQHYEGEAAMKLEALARPAPPYADGWRIDELDGHLNLDLLPLARRLVTLRDPFEIASRWHATLAAALADWLRHAMRATGVDTLALAGGCCANLTLMSGLRDNLRGDLQSAPRGRRRTLLHARRLPPGDDAISYGQAWATIGLLEHSPDDFLPSGQHDQHARHATGAAWPPHAHAAQTIAAASRNGTDVRPQGVHDAVHTGYIASNDASSYSQARSPIGQPQHPPADLPSWQRVQRTRHDAGQAQSPRAEPTIPTSRDSADNALPQGVFHLASNDAPDHNHARATIGQRQHLPRTSPSLCGQRTQHDTGVARSLCTAPTIPASRDKPGKALLLPQGAPDKLTNPAPNAAWPAPDRPDAPQTADNAGRTDS